MRRREWNHNTHHHSRVLRLLPKRSRRALDVGCGDGSFALALAGRAERVDALDTDARQVELATAACADLPNVTVSRGDFLEIDLPSGGYDVITALASLHHMPFERALTRAKDLLAPGGRLVVLDLWEDRRTRTDLVWNVASALYNRVLKAVHGPDHMGSPAAHQLRSLPEIRAITADLLPGSVVRRHLLWRCTIVWDKPH